MCGQTPKSNQFARFAPICTLVRDLDPTKHNNNKINSVLESVRHLLEEKIVVTIISIK